MSRPVYTIGFSYRFVLQVRPMGLTYRKTYRVDNILALNDSNHGCDLFFIRLKYTVVTLKVPRLTY